MHWHDRPAQFDRGVQRDARFAVFRLAKAVQAEIIGCNRFRTQADVAQSRQQLRTGRHSSLVVPRRGNFDQGSTDRSPDGAFDIGQALIFELDRLNDQ